jgi:pyruvate/2-oxoglutarate dehydrogenase complex dihydrolipoamide acyltransferase (E2) component
MSQEVRIPDIGDIDEVEVIEICVAPGDEVGPDDALIVIESDKASMLPSPWPWVIRSGKGPWW